MKGERRMRSGGGLLVGVLVAALPVRAQEAGPRLYRMVQGGVEVGREAYRRDATVLERSVVIPMLNLKLDSRQELDAAGRFLRFEASVFNARGDSARGTYAVVAGGDSLVATSVGAGGATRTRVLRLAAHGVIPAQSVSLVAEVVERSGGRDTTFRFLPMGGDSTVAVEVRRAGDTILVTTAGITARLTGGGTIEVPLSRLVVSVWNGHDSLPPLAGLVRPAKDFAAPAGAPYTAEQVRVVIRPAEGDTFSLAGTLTLPAAGRGPWPVVVTMSGSGPQDRDEDLWPMLERYRPFREIAERLAREGIGVLRTDDRTVGESGGSVGGTTADFAGDVTQLVAWLRARADVDPRRIALLGHSEGGLMGPLVAAEDPRIAAVVILAGPAKTGRAILRDQFRRPIETAPGLSAAERAEQLAAVEGRIVEWVGANAWSRWFADFDPLPVVRRLRMPVLIQHGALDRQVSVGQADTLVTTLRAAGNRDVSLKVYPRLNHLFLPSDGDGSPSEYAGLRQQALPVEVLDDTATWLAAKLVRR